MAASQEELVSDSKWEVEFTQSCSAGSDCVASDLPVDADRVNSVYANTQLLI